MARGAVMAGQEEAGAPPAAPPRAPGPKRGMPFGLTPRRLVEYAYIALLGFLLVRLVWAMTTPIVPPALPDAASAPGIDADLSVFGRFDPFGAAGPAEAEREASYAGAAETTLDLRLVGVTFGGGVKTATIEVPSGEQEAFLVGEEIVGGVTLRDVLPNQAILDRNGLAETLTLRDRSGRLGGRSGRGGGRDLAPSRRAPPTPTAQVITPGQALDVLSRALDFRQGEAGLVLAPGTEPNAFAAAGFAEGDVVTAVDGMAAPQDPERLLELMADLPPGRPFTVTVERGGVPLDVPVDLGSIR